MMTIILSILGLVSFSNDVSLVNKNFTRVIQLSWGSFWFYFLL